MMTCLITRLNNAYATRRVLSKPEVKQVYKAIATSLRRIEKLDHNYEILEDLWRYHHKKLRYKLDVPTPRYAVAKTPQPNNRLRVEIPRFLAHTERDRKQVSMAIRVLRHLRDRIEWLQAKRVTKMAIIRAMKFRRGPKYRYRGNKEKEI